MPFRPFKEYSGDISGRFIEIIAMNAQGSAGTNPAFLELLKEVPKHQRAGGYFCASGEINWQQPIDRNSNGESSVMMPALWGNARILCGLVEACRAFPDNKEILATAIKLGDFYAGVVPRFTDSARMTVKKGYCTAQKPVTGVTFVYAGCVYAEGRRCNRLPKGPVDGQPFALGFGPKLFAAANQSLTLPAWPTTVEVLKTQGVELMSSALRGKDYRFVFDR